MGTSCQHQNESSISGARTNGGESMVEFMLLA